MIDWITYSTRITRLFSGIPIFTTRRLASSEFKYSLVPSSLHIIQNLITKRVVEGGIEDAEKLLKVGVDGQKAALLMSDMESKMQENLKSLGFGGFVFVCKAETFFMISPAFCSSEKIFLDLSDQRKKHYLFLLNGNLDCYWFQITIPYISQ